MDETVTGEPRTHLENCRADAGGPGRGVMQARAGSDRHDGAGGTTFTIPPERTPSVTLTG